MAAFNATTDVSWKAYLAAADKLTGYQRQQLADEMLRWLCWCITNTGTINASTFAAAIPTALLTLDGTRQF